MHCPDWSVILRMWFRMIHQKHLKRLPAEGKQIPIRGGYLAVSKDEIWVVLRLRAGKWEFDAPVLRYDAERDTIWGEQVYKAPQFRVPDDLTEAIRASFRFPMSKDIEGATIYFSWCDNPFFYCQVKTKLGCFWCRILKDGLWEPVVNENFLRLIDNGIRRLTR